MGLNWCYNHLTKLKHNTDVKVQYSPSAFSYLLIRLVLCFSEEADVLDESRLDVLVVHKLAEDVKLLPQELVGEIHLMKENSRPQTSF